METDSFFYQLFKQLPQTLFELIDVLGGGIVDSPLPGNPG
jgi:hypothetical protein